jgi:hypothetical protein
MHHSFNFIRKFKIRLPNHMLYEYGSFCQRKKRLLFYNFALIQRCLFKAISLLLSIFAVFCRKLPFCDFWTQHACLSLCTNFHQNRVVIAHFIPCTWISNMAVAAILKIGVHFRFCDFWTQHVFRSLCTNFDRNHVVIAHLIACTRISNMAAAAILKAVGHFRFCIFDFDMKSRTYLSNFIGIRRKLTDYSSNLFIMAAAAILDLTIGDLWPEI